MSYHIVIPARYESTRLPGKALLDIGGKPIIWHVYQQALKSGAASVTIATDDVRIFEVAKGFNADALMTKKHPSGTDRLAEVCSILGFSDDTSIVNLQGDEPLMPPELIQQVARLLIKDSNASMATLCWPIQDIEQFQNPNVVKAVFDSHQHALYFSRAPIPYHREQPLHAILGYRHIGLYAYRAGFLKRFVNLEPAPLEMIEKLEQLRALYHGYKIRIEVSKSLPPQDVNTKEDLEALRAMMACIE